MKRLLLLFVLTLLSLESMAQRRKTIFAELGGNGITASANFDMRFKPDQNDGLGIRVGAGGGTYSGSDSNGNTADIGLLTFPVAVNYLTGKKRGSFEGGVGITPMYATASGRINEDKFDVDGFGLTGFLNMGYRYQPLEKGLMFHIKWTPAINSAGFSGNWWGLGLGYSFK